MNEDPEENGGSNARMRSPLRDSNSNGRREVSVPRESANHEKKADADVDLMVDNNNVIDKVKKSEKSDSKRGSDPRSKEDVSQKY